MFVLYPFYITMKIKINSSLPKTTFILFLSILVSFLHSCKKIEESKILDSKEELATLTAWYSTVSKSENNFSSLKPQWNKILKTENSEFLIYEVKLENPEGIFTSYSTIDLKSHDNLSTNTFRIIVFVNKKDNKDIKGGYLSIAPKNKELDPQNIHFSSLEDFSGKVSLYDMSSRFVKGLIYDAGLVKQVMSNSGTVLKRNELYNLYQKSTPLNGVMGHMPNTVMLNESCNYDLEPVYGQACVEAGESGQVTCNPYVRYYNVIYHCQDEESIEPTDLNNPGGGGGSGETYPSDVIPDNPVTPGQDKSPIDPKKYTDCFSNIPDAGATYKVTVQVEEPVPGTRLNYDILNPISGRGVGHTAITVTKTGADGASVTQTVGFYPAESTFASPSKMVDNAKAGDTEKIEFTVSMEFDLGNDATNFNKILSHIASPPANYNLFGMNCTAFVVGACSSGGINLPDAMTVIARPLDPAGFVNAMTPAGLGDSMRKAKAAGDNRVKPTQKVAPTSKGACN